MAFAEYLRALMDTAGISDYAELSRLSGINQTQLSNWRRGISQPSRESLSKIAPVLGVRASNLWLVADLADEEELGLDERPDLTVLPRAIAELIDVWRDGRLSDEQRAALLSAVALAVSGVRAQLGKPDRGRPIRRRPAS